MPTVRSSLGVSTIAGFVVIVTALTAACGGQPTICASLRFSEAATDQYAETRETLEFSPTLPCSFRSDIEVVRVLGSVVPAGSPQPQISFVAERRGERGFIFSATRAEVPFTDIPQGTHWLRIASGEVIASGFSGPSGGGEEIAYLRWRIDGVTYELAATLRPWLTEDDIRLIARALMSGGSPSAQSRA